MDIGNLLDPNRKRWESALKKAKAKDFSELSECLRDGSLTMHQAYKDSLANILTRGRGREHDQRALRRAKLRSYLVYLKFRAQGDKPEFAYENAARKLSISPRTVRGHVKEVETDDSLQFEAEWIKKLVEMMLITDAQRSEQIERLEAETDEDETK